MTVLIPRNTTIPTSKTEVFSTASDNQPEVTINVLQGEREFAKDNRLLGNFSLGGIPPAPRGTPQIEVTFNIDVNGILHVSAKDRATGKENKTTVEKSGGLSKEEVEKMKRDAETHAADDKKRREVIDLKNKGESLAYQTEKMLKDNGDKVSGGTRSEIESALNQLRDNLKGEDGAAIQKAMTNLESISHKLAEEMYKAGGTPPGADGGAGPAPRSPGRPGNQERRGRHRRRVRSQERLIPRQWSLQRPCVHKTNSTRVKPKNASPAFVFTCINPAWPWRAN